MSDQTYIDKFADTRDMSEVFKAQLTLLTNNIRTALKLNVIDNDSFENTIRIFCAALVDSGKASQLNSFEDIVELLKEGTDFDSRTKFDNEYSDMLIQGIYDQSEEIAEYMEIIAKSQQNRPVEFDFLWTVEQVLRRIGINRLKRKKLEMEEKLTRITTSPDSEEAIMAAKVGVFIEGDEDSLRKGISQLEKAIKQLAVIET